MQEILSDEELQKIYKNIGNNVKKYREKKGLSQLELSQAMGHKSVSLVSKAEIGIENVHFGIKHLFILAKILDVDISNLINLK